MLWLKLVAMDCGQRENKNVNGRQCFCSATYFSFLSRFTVSWNPRKWYGKVRVALLLHPNAHFVLFEHKQRLATKYAGSELLEVAYDVTVYNNIYWIGIHPPTPLQESM